MRAYCSGKKEFIDWRWLIKNNFVIVFIRGISTLISGMKTLLYFLICFLSACQENDTTFRNETVSSVVAIQDGDTIELRLVYYGKEARNRDGKNLRIRLAHIDCNERGQPFYKVAKDFTSDRCFGKEVKIIHENEFDRYGRLIGEVILPDGTNLNQELVKAGLARHYKKYSHNEKYALLEEKARARRIGIWQ
jgi:micrococcal nuclease